MCGILAVLKSSDTIRLEPLKRRGPDESGFYEDDDIYIGHTRLSIVHPEAGAQPIRYNGWIAAMNGEIYNASPEQNETDCHHLVKAVVADGPLALLQMDGVFSFFLYHPETKRIIMGRDPIGVTPMYYSESCVSSLLTCITSGTARAVPTGSVASFVIGETPVWQKYTSPYKFLPESGKTDSLKFLMYKAVTKRLMGDVPWGVLLSGGLDSSIVTAIACKIAAAHRPDYPKVHSFCIGLEDSPDVKQAEKLAKDLGTHHTSIRYTIPEGIAAVDDVIRAVETYDVTTIRASVPMWLLARAISKRGIKVVLSGEGSDELFAGYLYNLYCPNVSEMEAECKRKISQLYAYDCLRANKSMGDFGVETRVPFLDKDVVDYAMNVMDPTLKLSGTHPDGPKAEKWFLRDLFRDELPDYIVDRTKAQFSDAVGSSWIDALQSFAEQVTEEQMASAAERWPFQTPDTKEAYFYRDIFSKHFGDIEGASETVIFQPSIACSTKQGILWHENFKKCVDPSGDAIQRAFE